MERIKIKSNNFSKSSFSNFKITGLSKHKVLNKSVYLHPTRTSYDRSLTELVGTIVDYDKENEEYTVELNPAFIRDFNKFIYNGRFIDDIRIGLSILANYDYLVNENYTVMSGFLSISYGDEKNIGYYQYLEDSNMDSFDIETLDKVKSIAYSKKYNLINMNVTNSVFVKDDIFSHVLEYEITGRRINKCDIIFILIPEDVKKEDILNENKHIITDNKIYGFLRHIDGIGKPYKFITKNDIMKGIPIWTEILK